MGGGPFTNGQILSVAFREDDFFIEDILIFSKGAIWCPNCIRSLIMGSQNGCKNFFYFFLKGRGFH
jgi:hypothetical protein